MHQNDATIKKIPHFDLLLDGINFTAGLVALAAQKSGINVAIKLPSVLNLAFQPELSLYYPTRINNLATSIKNVKFLSNCSSLFPQLFFPQRVLSFNVTHTINSRFNALADQLLNRDREWGTLAIDTNKYENYQAIANEFRNGSLVYEYRFDRNWAIIKLLQMCQSQGVQFFSNLNSVNEEVRLACPPFKQDHNTLILPQHKWLYSNNMAFERDNIKLAIYAVCDDTYIAVYPKKNNLNLGILQNEINSVVVPLGINLPNDFTIQVQQVFNSLYDKQNESNEFCFDANLLNLRNNFNQLILKVSKITGRPINAKRLFNQAIDQQMNGEMFRTIQAECDEKYDLAKQTGIAYKTFVNLFYRHRDQIDQMIENAYKLMAQIRDPIIIWQIVEQEIIKNIMRTISEPTS